MRSTAKHLDRDGVESSHINKEKSRKNIYWNRYDGEYNGTSFLKMKFTDVEKRFYKETFENYIQDRNLRAIKQGHRERMTSVNKMISNRNTMAQETILQVGSTKSNQVVKPEDLWEIWRSFKKWHEEKFPQIMLLDCALHVDESYPHLHYRQVYVYENNGILQVGQEKCLSQMNIELPDKSKKRGRFNNRKQTYSYMVRERFIELCNEKGYEIIEEALKYRRHNMTKEELMVDELKRELKCLVKEKRKKQKEIKYIDYFNEYVKEIETEVERERIKQRDKGRG